jgi:hypothetical protein
MTTTKRITVYIDHADSSTDADWMEAWFAKWGPAARIENESTGGWEHTWDIEAPVEAVAEIPQDWLCASEWATPEIFGKR